jgi:AcrR family transcriptional regulator
MPTRQPALPRATTKVPTGVPIPDIRDQLYVAAESVLLRDGPDALTSRAVTTEAGVAKGILHRHFRDFDGFLAAFVLSHIERLDTLAGDLRAAAGTATVAENVAGALAAALSPSALGIISLVCSRRELLSRLRLTSPTGIPLATEISKMIAAYLTAERGLGRIAIQTDVDSLAVLLVGGAHLRAAGLDDRPIGPEHLGDLLEVVIESDAGRRAGRVTSKS